MIDTLRHISGLVIALWLGMAPLVGMAQGASGSTPAKSAASDYPAWLVPVVRVRDDGRVVPTTGVVLREGRVLIANAFAATTDSLVVLDGGADLATHGRTATIIRRAPLAGLALLDVPGLRRPPPTLARGPLRNGQGVLLHAMAPPDLLLTGQARVQRVARLLRQEQGPVSLDETTPLPNVTGVLLDGCGLWVGLSLARGAASLSTSSPTLYQWVPELSAQLNDLGIAPRSADCTVDSVSLSSSPRNAPVQDREDETSEVSVEQDGQDPIEPEKPPVSDPDPSGDAGANAEVADRLRDFPELTSDPLAFPGPEGSVGTGEAGEPEVVTSERGVVARYGPWVLGILGVAGLFLVLIRRRNRQAASVTAAFMLDGDQDRPVLWARAGQVDCTVGRYGADVIIEGGSVSRSHARFYGDLERLQLVDLGSMNGTWVNGRPCAANIAVLVGAGDRLQFGDREFTLRAVNP